MYYFNRDNELGYISKFEVNYDKKGLIDLAKEINFNCGTRELKYLSKSPRSYYFIVNGSFEEQVNNGVLNYDYDKCLVINKPNIVKYIEKFINEDDVSLLDYLYFDKEIEEDISINEMLNRKIKKINSVTVDESWKRKLYKEELDLIKSSLSFNENLDSVSSYISRIYDLIKIEYIDSYSIEDLEKYNNFFNFDENNYIKKI